MTDLLLRLFVKHASDISDPAVRAGYGRLAGVTGIVCNLLLFALKLLAGTISGSVSITADAVNNLSDASGSIVTLVGFKLASRPADDEHPYGHARMEYLSGLAVAVLILVIGVELVKSSVGKILHPEAVEFSALIVVILVCSILVKLWMAVFNRKLGRRIGSAALTAAAADSRNDVISTGAVLLACIVGQLTGLKIDGYVGLLVALFILWSGVGIAKDTIDPLLGAKPDESLVHAIAYLMTSHPSILGIHDLMVHNYGPGKIFASAHIEMDAGGDVMTNHDIIDNIERQVKHSLRIEFVAHMDPIKTNDPQVNKTRAAISEAFSKMDGLESIHDFRIVPGPSHTNVIFDVVLSHNCILTENDIRSIAKRALDELGDGHTYYPVITFDKMYTHLGNEENL